MGVHITPPGVAWALICLICLYGCAEAIRHIRHGELPILSLPRLLSLINEMRNFIATLAIVVGAAVVLTLALSVIVTQFFAMFEGHWFFWQI